MLIPLGRILQPAITHSMAAIPVKRSQTA